MDDVHTLMYFTLICCKKTLSNPELQLRLIILKLVGVNVTDIGGGSVATNAKDWIDEIKRTIKALEENYDDKTLNELIKELKGMVEPLNGDKITERVDEAVIKGFEAEATAKNKSDPRNSTVGEASLGIVNQGILNFTNPVYEDESEPDADGMDESEPDADGMDEAVSGADSIDDAGPVADIYESEKIIFELIYYIIRLNILDISQFKRSLSTIETVVDEHIYSLYTQYINQGICEGLKTRINIMKLITLLGSVAALGFTEGATVYKILMFFKKFIEGFALGNKIKNKNRGKLKPIKKNRVKKSLHCCFAQILSFIFISLEMELYLKDNIDTKYLIRFLLICTDEQKRGKLTEDLEYLPKKPSSKGSLSKYNKNIKLSSISLNLLYKKICEAKSPHIESFVKYLSDKGLDRVLGGKFTELIQSATTISGLVSGGKSQVNKNGSSRKKLNTRKKSRNKLNTRKKSRKKLNTRKKSIKKQIYKGRN